MTGVSSSDVQKRLRELLPRDYAKKYRSFRPLPEHPNSTRLDKLRKRSYCRYPPLLNHIESKPQDFRLSEAPVSAFRDYSDPADRIRNHKTLIGCSQEQPESQIVVPSLLPLNGSSLLPTIEEAVEPPDTNPTTTKSTLPSSQISSVLSLGQPRLKRSSSLLRQVHSALRFSSTNSWRSSLSNRSSDESVQSAVRMKGIVHTTLQSRHTSNTESPASVSRESGQSAILLRQ